MVMRLNGCSVCMLYLMGRVVPWRALIACHYQWEGHRALWSFIDLFRPSPSRFDARQVLRLVRGGRTHLVQASATVKGKLLSQLMHTNPGLVTQVRTVWLHQIGCHPTRHTQ